MLGVQSLGPVMPRFAADAPSAAGIAEGSGGASARTATTESSLTERDAWTILTTVSGVGPVVLGQLIEAFGSGRAVLETAARERGAELLFERLASIPGERELPASLAHRIADAAQTGGRTLDRLRALAVDVVTLEDAAYPERLRRVDMPPPLLFVRGDVTALSWAGMVAVVGTRWPTDRGRLTAGWIGAALSNAGACVVSGLAVGIDGAAHAATVAEGGRTVAVLGGGHARLFPKAHARLADEIVRTGGAVVSEHAPDVAPSRGTFPRRNRLVSGMADATIVVEAGRRSGALITAGWALEQGRECFLVPGSLGAPMSAGCLAFLRSFPGQARVVCGIPELIEDLGLAPVSVESSPTNRDNPTSSALAAGPAATLAALSPIERTVAERLARGAATLDDLVAASGSTPAATLSVLTLLELRGLVTASYGRYVPAGALARPPLAAGSYAASSAR